VLDHPAALSADAAAFGARPAGSRRPAQRPRPPRSGAPHSARSRRSPADPLGMMADLRRGGALGCAGALATARRHTLGASHQVTDGTVRNPGIPRISPAPTGTW